MNTFKQIGILKIIFYHMDDKTRSRKELFADEFLRGKDIHMRTNLP